MHAKRDARASRIRRADSDEQIWAANDSKGGDGDGSISGVRVSSIIIIIIIIVRGT